MDGRLQPQLRDSAGKLRERQAGAIGEARTASLLARLKTAGPLIGWMLAPGVLLAIIGPFGSFGAPFAMRLLYWAPTMAVGAVLGGVAAHVLERAFPALPKRPLVFMTALSIVITLVMVFVVWGWGVVVFGERAGIDLSLRLFLYVGVVAFAISALRTLFDRRRPAEIAVSAKAPAATPALSVPVLARRLKPELRAADILALQAEDHYVRVHTAAGNELNLLRLTDAVAEMSGTPGVRTHRSWWVSRDAVAAAAREKGRLSLKLANGLVVPVSRAASGEVTRALPEKV